MGAEGLHSFQVPPGNMSSGKGFKSDMDKNNKKNFNGLKHNGTCCCVKIINIFSLSSNKSDDNPIFEIYIQ